MFCYQCEQTAKGTGCSTFGVCGKDAETAEMQDLLLLVAKGISAYAVRAGQLGWTDRKVDEFVVEALFTTVTNVNFDAAKIAATVHQAAEMRDKAKSGYEQAAKAAGKTPEKLSGPAFAEVSESLGEMTLQAHSASILVRSSSRGESLTGLEELVTYGLKGAAAYADHALILDRYQPEMYQEFHRLLDLTNQELDQGGLLKAALETGALNLKVMETLDEAHTSTFGHPVPTQVRVHPVQGKAILVSGHDLLDLKALLEQTQGKGINIYTHGEMLPAHGYPELKKYPHLKGNYGGAWQDQKKEFAAFPGAILMTTNCIQKPQDNYMERIFTCGLVQWPGVTHISNRDFQPVIEAALDSDGFAQDGPDQTILVGFGHNAVLGVADKVIEAVKAGKIRHFFLVGGCDGAKSGRNYYTDFAASTPKDTVILTLACGKYRFNKMEFGDIGGIPRLLDIGQCNDAYSAIQIAVALAGAFGTDVNGLPLSMILSWYEQKAVAILLTLLHLGVKKIRLGPSLPAFVTPDVLNILVDAFQIQPIGTVEDDLKACLEG